MRRRPVRVLVLLVTVAVTAAAVWRATSVERARGRERLAEQQVDARAADAIYALADLRAALHAYVAAGQGLAFWSGRAAEVSGRITTLLDELDPAATAARHPLGPAREALARLSAAEIRARGHVQNDQLLLAGDVIYAEASGLIDEVTRELSGARQALARAASAREAGTANAQSLLAGGVLSTWIVALMLLVPIPRTPDPVPAASGLSLGGPVVLGGPDSAPETPPAAVASPPPAQAVPAADLDALAGVCEGLGTVTSSDQLAPLLERAASLLQAKGLVVWLPDPGRQSLSVATAHGYDDALLARFGTTARDADNLTARAFRSGEPAVSPASATQPAAVAVPLPAAGGPGGVLAAELAPGGSPDLPQVTALARVIAAQMAGLFGSASTQSDEPPRSAPAQA